MKRKTTASGRGIWVLSDREMLRFSIYAQIAEEHFKKRGAADLQREAKNVRKAMDLVFENLGSNI